MKKVLFIFVFFIFILMTLSGCNKDENKELKEKVIQEIEYFDSKIITMLNELNNISFENYTLVSKEITVGTDSKSQSQNTSKQSMTTEGTDDKKVQSGNTITATELETDTILESDQNNIDWKAIKSEIELLNSSWSIVLLDLYDSNVNNDDILNFSRALDISIISIKNENKKDSLSNLAILYSYLPKYLESISAENGMQNAIKTKSYLINAYALLEQDDWTNIMTNVIEAEKTLNNILNDLEFIKNREYKANKSYVLLKEFQSSLETKDKQIFYLKYKNLMESINTL